MQAVVNDGVVSSHKRISVLPGMESLLRWCGTTPAGTDGYCHPPERDPGEEPGPWPACHHRVQARRRKRRGALPALRSRRNRSLRKREVRRTTCRRVHGRVRALSASVDAAAGAHQSVPFGPRSCRRMPDSLHGVVGGLGAQQSASPTTTGRSDRSAPGVPRVSGGSLTAPGMLNRYSSRRQPLDAGFLNARLAGARTYDRIARLLLLFDPGSRGGGAGHSAGADPRGLQLRTLAGGRGGRQGGAGGDAPRVVRIAPRTVGRCRRSAQRCPDEVAVEQRSGRCSPVSGTGGFRGGGGDHGGGVRFGLRRAAGGGRQALDQGGGDAFGGLAHDQDRGGGDGVRRG